MQDKNTKAGFSEDLGSVEAAIGMAALVLLFGGLTLAIYPGWKTVGAWLNDANAAAWIQAIGSIVAIAAAAGIANYQASHARRLENDKRIAAEVQKLSVITALMARTYGLANDVIRAMKEPNEYNFAVIDTKLMRDTAETLRGLPLFDVPSGLAALDIRSTSNYLDRLAEYWTDIIDTATNTGIPPPPQTISSLVDYCEEIAKISHDSLNDSKRQIEIRGGTWT